jgi:legumain
MQTKKLFNELVFYMEACESGSMFPDLASDSKIFAVTAANAKESSWGYYCSPNDTAGPRGKHLNTCLGDLFSIAWMEDTDLGKMGGESLSTQVQRVTKRTNKSHVSTFGDKSFNSEVIGHFESRAAKGIAGPTPGELVGGAVNTRDIHLWYWQNRVNQASNPDEKKAAQKKVDQTNFDRKADLQVFTNIAGKACEGGLWGCHDNVMRAKQELTNHVCHEALVKTVHEACPKRGSNAPGGWNSYNMRFSQVLANACQLPDSISKSTETLTKIVRKECTASSTTSAVDVVV